MAIFPYLVFTSCCLNESGEQDVLEFNVNDVTINWWTGSCPSCTTPNSIGVWVYSGPAENGLINNACYEVTRPNYIPPETAPINPAPVDLYMTPTGFTNCQQTSNIPACSCSDVCYVIQPCDESVPPFQISLSDTETVLLNIGQVYTFNDPSSTLIDNGCYKVLEEAHCITPLYINVTVIKDYDSTDCDVCIPCYELTDCSDPDNTVIIKWDPEDIPLDELTAYVFDFAPSICWSAELQFSPCEGTQYDASHITTSYIDCDECLKPCYKLIDCEGLYPTISTNNPIFQGYVGSVIFWQDVLGKTHCATVEVYECKNENFPVEPIIVLDCYDTCIECLPQPIPIPTFQISNRSATPGYNTAGCSPEYTEKINCKFSESVFQEMIAKRYGLDSCCDIDGEKYEIKKALLDLAAIKEPYLCEPICVDYNYSLELNIGDSAITTYIDCDGLEQTVIRTAVSTYTDYALTVCALTTMVPVIVVTRANMSIEQYKLTTSYNTCCPVEITCIGYTICMSNGGNGEQRVRYFDCDGAEQEITLVPKQPNTFYYFCGLPGQTLTRDFVFLPSDTFEVNQVDCTELPPVPTGSCAAP